MHDFLFCRMRELERSWVCIAFLEQNETKPKAKETWHWICQSRFSSPAQLPEITSLCNRIWDTGAEKWMDNYCSCHWKQFRWAIRWLQFLLFWWYRWQEQRKFVYKSANLKVLSKKKNWLKGCYIYFEIALSILAQQVKSVLGKLWRKFVTKIKLWSELAIHVRFLPFLSFFWP